MKLRETTYCPSCGCLTQRLAQQDTEIAVLKAQLSTMRGRVRACDDRWYLKRLAARGAHGPHGGLPSAGWNLPSDRPPTTYVGQRVRPRGGP